MVSRLVKTVYPLPQQDVSKKVTPPPSPILNMSQFVHADKKLTAKAWLEMVNGMMLNMCTQANFMVTKVFDRLTPHS